MYTVDAHVVEHLLDHERGRKKKRRRGRLDVEFSRESFRRSPQKRIDQGIKAVSLDVAVFSRRLPGQCFYKAHITSENDEVFVLDVLRLDRVVFRQILGDVFLEDLGIVRRLLLCHRMS